MTFLAGNAIKGAAELALKKWQDEERPAVATYEYRPPKTTPYDPETGQSDPNFSYGYMAQFVEVEVDVETGHVEVVRVVSAHDVGKAINPRLLEGQIEGAVVQALGYAIMENLVTQDGRILNPYLSTYLIPTIWDVPQETKLVILEYADPRGPWGARGVAEMPFIPLAPAIVAAVHDATGVWFERIPLTPDRVVSKLREQGIGVI
jgi:CO/xanthine dehydrogenase Mo-binding subunit